MKFSELLNKLGDQSSFDYESVRVLFGENSAATRTALHRLKAAGKITELKRGIYAFAEPYRRAQINAAYIASILYSPSYLSERWALSWYGVIPEKTTIFTSVTPRSTRTFENDFGTFQYRTIQPRLFGSYRIDTILSREVRIANPEKALLDLWYLEHGEWTTKRMESFRFEPRAIHTRALLRLTEDSGIPRLVRAARAWEVYARDASEGVIL